MAGVRIVALCDVDPQPLARAKDKLDQSEVFWATPAVTENALLIAPLVPFTTSGTPATWDVRLRMHPRGPGNDCMPTPFSEETRTLKRGIQAC